MELDKLHARWRGLPAITRLLSLFAAAHVALLLLLPGAMERMLIGDRGGGRDVKLRRLIEAGQGDEQLRMLLWQSHPGDYIFFLPAYALGGGWAVIVQSLALYAAGAYFLYKLVRLLWDERAAIVATAAYVLLPATIFHPHALVSEAICNPLLIIAVYLVVRGLLEPRLELAHAAAAGAALAVVCFVRQGFAPLALALAGLLLIAARDDLSRRARASVVVAGLSLAPLLLWSLFAATVGASYPQDPGGASLGANFYLKAERMAAVGGFALPGIAAERQAATGAEAPILTPSEYAGVVLEHPLAFARMAASDVFNLMANPGVSMVAGRFLGLFDLGEQTVEDLNKWREVRDRQGLPGLLAELWRTSPTGLVLNALGFALWAGFLAVAAFGAWRMLRSRLPGLVALAPLFLVIAYQIVLTALAAGYSRWDHRSPFEPFLAAMFAVGVLALLDQRVAQRLLERLQLARRLAALRPAK